ncbi:SDR family oxidoreductase [Aureimonas leprariae]|uniref:SDR family oxidoreductase n=1 Tax=Plantimonas leprariae TaxID=2615207 RepID=A0A7V7TVD9_9HYPH|nr:SDR family oxidoreductase [Aureimonas leprariae]
MEAKGELAGRIAIVTGSSRNIGRAIALSLAEAGAAILVHARGSKPEAEAVAAEIRAAGGRAAVALGDVAKPEDTRRIAKAALQAFGRIDILVNNAAVRREAEFGTVDYSDWREVLGTILDGAFLLTQACLPELKRSGAGSVVNIGGLTGHTGAEKRVHVVAAKAGLVGLTKALAHDLAPQAITVNCVSPGMIDTVRGASAPSNPAHHATRRTLVGRRGTPEEVAAAVRYLCGPQARFVTGQTIHVNGGTYLP